MESKEGNGSTSRLPSFSGPRALKITPSTGRLATPGRRTFMPNVAAATSSDAKNPIAVKKETHDAGKTQSDNRRGGRGRPGGPRGRGGGRDLPRRDKPELIQSEGVFADGVGAKTVLDRKSATSYSSEGRSGSSHHGIATGKAKDSLKKIEHGKTKNSGDIRSRLQEEPMQTDDDGLAPRMIPLSVDDVSPLFRGLDLSGPNGTVMLLRLPEELPILKEQEASDSAAQESLAADISSFPEGALGNLCVGPSGKMSLTIGKNKFELESGNHAEFHQELILVNGDNVIPMGTVRQKFICRTDIDSLINPQLS